MSGKQRAPNPGALPQVFSFRAFGAEIIGWPNYPEALIRAFKKPAVPAGFSIHDSLFTIYRSPQVIENCFVEQGTIFRLVRR